MMECLNRFEFGFLCLIYQAIRSSVSFVCVRVYECICSLSAKWSHYGIYICMRSNCSLGGIHSMQWMKNNKKVMRTERRNTRRNMKTAPTWTDRDRRQREIFCRKNHFAFILEIKCAVRMVFDWLTMAVAVRTFVRNFQSLSLSSAQFFIFEFFSLCLYVSMNCSRILFMKISVLFFQPTSPPPAATNTHTHTPPR